jgi:two-component system response regulator MtrA
MVTVDVLLVGSDGPVSVVAQALAGAGIEVQLAPSAEEALYEHARRDVDVVVTAIELTGMDGVELCRVLKEQSPVGVIVLTDDGHPAALAAFAAGADDVVDPGQPAELAARVRALVRRRRGSLRPRREVRVGGLVAVWTPGGRLRVVDDRFALSPIEATVLEVLVERPGCVVTAELLRDRVIERHGAPAGAALEAAVTRLGVALADAGAGAALQRVPDGGWLLAA